MLSDVSEVPLFGSRDNFGLSKPLGGDTGEPRNGRRMNLCRVSTGTGHLISAECDTQGCPYLPNFGVASVEAAAPACPEAL